MENFELQFMITNIINGLMQLIVLIAAIIMLIKKRNTATVLLCIGSALTTLGIVGGIIYNAMAARDGTEGILRAQIHLNYFNTFAYIIFAIGLLLLAFTYFENNNNKIE